MLHVIIYKYVCKNLNAYLERENSEYLQSMYVVCTVGSRAYISPDVFTYLYFCCLNGQVQMEVIAEAILCTIIYKLFSFPQYLIPN